MLARRAWSPWWWGRVVRIAAPVGAFVVEGPAAAVGTALIQEAMLWIAARIGSDCKARRLFLIAFAVRVAVALPTHYVAKLEDGNGSLFLDDYINDLVAEWLVRIGRGEGLSIFPGHQHVLDGLYPFLLMGIYAIFGHAPVLPKVLNMALGALNAVLIYEIARQLYRPTVAMLAGLGAAVVPSLVIWSVVSVKESLVLSVALIGLLAIQRLAGQGAGTRRSDAALVLLAAAVVSLDLRATTSLILVGLVGILWLARAQAQSSPRKWRVPLTAAAIVIVVVSAGWTARSVTSNRAPMGVLEDIMLQLRHRRAHEALGARTQIRPQEDITTPDGRQQPSADPEIDAAPLSVMGDVLEPLGYALLAPAPWQARNLMELAVSGEMLGWYVLLAGSLFAWRADPRQPLVLACLVLYGAANWLVLAATEGNLGNLLRHRVMLAPTLLVLGSAGLEWLWMRRGRT